MGTASDVEVEEAASVRHTTAPASETTCVLTTARPTAASAIFKKKNALGATTSGSRAKADVPRLITRRVSENTVKECYRAIHERRDSFQHDACFVTICFKIGDINISDKFDMHCNVAILVVINQGT